MLNSPRLRLRLIIVAAMLAAALMLTTANAGADFSWAPMNKPAVCRGSAAECMVNGGEFEFDMDSESNRRMLATSNYISYGALQANKVPCSRSGASYYNCQPGGEANPYTRSCSAASQCRSG